MSLMQWAHRVAKSAPKPSVLEIGPWLGSMRSVSSELVPMGYLASPSQTPALDFLYLPKYGSWKRRGGQSIKFDVTPSSVGLLPATWNDEPAADSGGARCRQIEEFVSDSVTNNIPTVCALATREVTPSTALDIGRFSNFWLRDQVNVVNYTLCDEYSSTITYPSPGSTQYYRVVPLWYDSGDGGITRGVTEFLRRFLVSGSRRFQKVGRWVYFPSYFGTPSRWSGRYLAGNANTGTTAFAMASAGAWTDQAGGVASLHTVIDEFPFSTTDYVKVDVNLGGQISLELDITTPSPLPSSSTPHHIQFQYRRTGGSGTTPGLVYTFYKGNEAVTIKSATLASLPITTTWTDYSFTLSAAEVTSLANPATGGGAYNLMSFFFNWTGAAGTAGSEIQVSGLRVSFGNSITSTTLDSNAIRLIPSGPFPPCHTGTIAGAAAVPAEYTYPNADSVDGSWVNTAATNVNLFSYIDDTVGSTNDADWIRSAGSNTACTIDLATPSTVSNISDTVTIRYRNRNIVGSGHNNTVMEFLMNGTIIASQFTQFTTTSEWATYGRALTEDEITAATAADATWATASIRFTTSSESAGSDDWYISQAYLERLPAAATSEGGWKGKDRFYKAVAYRFEDDSIWATTTPRAPNTNLTSGLDLVTVDFSNPELAYTKVVWSNLPIPPNGVKKLVLLRTPKIDSSVEDNLLLNQYDLRVVAEVDAGTTTYDDFFGDDDALVMDVDATRIRFDHDMPNPARYNAAGAMRMAHAYEKGQNPCAIVIAPIGRSADYDLNLADTSSTAYTNDASLMRLSLDTSSVMTLTLANDTGAATAVVSYTSTTYATIQALVDKINSTSFAVDGQQWRAQLCPNTSPDAATTSLCPHSRQIASCVTATSTALTKAGGGLSKVAVGQRVTGTNIAASTYVIRIVSDTELTLSAATTGNGTNTMTFFNDLGDTVTSDAASISVNSFHRVIANSLPGFLYFNKTYLDTFPANKSTVSMTVASPGASLSAPNCFNTDSIRRLANRYTAPLEAGIAQGLVPVDDGFVVPFANKVGAVKPRSQDRIRDEDYSLVIISEDRGCCAWNTVATGNRFATLMAPDGLYAADLDRMMRISGAIWTPPTSDNTTTNVVGIGDFSYEMPRSIAATAQDNDSSYASVKVVGGVIWVAYRTSASATHANRLVAYDFSASSESAGLQALLRDDGGARWGWSLPLSRSVSVIGTGRRDDGSHLYGWSDANAGTTGDGRIDELETGSTDNGTEVSTATASIPWIQADEGENISVQQVILEHNSPTGSVGTLVWHRSYSNDSYSLTAGTSSLDMLSELKMLTTPARAITAAGYFEYKQASGGAREWRKLKVWLIRSPRLRPAS